MENYYYYYQIRGCKASEAKYDDIWGAIDEAVTEVLHNLSSIYKDIDKMHKELIIRNTLMQNYDFEIYKITYLFNGEYEKQFVKVGRMKVWK